MNKQTQKNFKLPDVTIDQLRRWADKFGSMTRVVIVAVDRLDKQESERHEQNNDQYEGLA